MYGIGIWKGLTVTFRHFVDTLVDDIHWFGRRNGLEAFQTKQSLKGKGMYTVQYPEEKIAVPERFRFVPFLVQYDHDDPEYPDKDWCTSCGICAKVCPPQCIWIVRGTNPQTGRPKPEPEQFFIDIDICMNCGYCAEYCPFDAIKMDHDYELASYDRTSNHIYDKAKLSKPVSYWQAIAPTVAAEELAARGGYDHTDVQKARKKAGLPASRPGPISDKPQTAPATPAASTGTVAAGVAAEATPNRPAPEQAPAVSAQLTSPTPAPTSGATHTADGKPIVRRRGAGAAAAGAPKPAAVAAGGNPVGPQVQPEKVDPQAQSQQSVAAPSGETAPTASSATAPDASGQPQKPEGDPPRSQPKPRDPNAPPQQVVRRRNNPPPKKG